MNTIKETVETSVPTINQIVTNRYGTIGLKEDKKHYSNITQVISNSEFVDLQQALTELMETDEFMGLARSACKEQQEMKQFNMKRSMFKSIKKKKSNICNCTTKSDVVEPAPMRNVNVEFNKNFGNDSAVFDSEEEANMQRYALLAFAKMPVDQN